MPENRYRTLIVASHPVPYAVAVFRALARHPRFEVHVAYCSLRGAQAEHDPEFGATVQWDVPLLDGYSWSYIPNWGTGKESFWSLRNPGLWSLIRKRNFDAVLMHIGYTRATFWIAYMAARSSETAFLFGCDQGSLEARDKRAWKRKAKRFAWPLLFRLADQVVVSSSSARELIRSLRIPEDHISLTPLVVDNDWWIAKAAEVNRMAVREAWGVGENDTVFLFCAKLQPWKRPLDLLRAFALAGIRDSVLVFAGDGPPRKQLEAEAEVLGVQARVHFFGFVNQSELPAVYTASDLMVLPSEYEPFAVVVNEAMCCGCPVAASDRVGAARDLVLPVSPELVFECGDIPALAKILRDAAADRARMASLGKAARERMRSWSPAQNIAATVEAIELAVSHASGRSADTIAGCSPRASAATPHKSHD